MDMRTHNEVFQEAKRLKEIRDKVPRTTQFGENNTNAIDAQIEVLEKDILINDIHALSNAEGEHDETKWSTHTRDAAILAREWMDTDNAVPPSRGWEAMIQSTPQLPKKTPTKAPAPKAGKTVAPKPGAKQKASSKASAKPSPVPQRRPTTATMRAVSGSTPVSARKVRGFSARKKSG